MFKGHPTGLKVLFFTEMWERFGYYLMIGILSLYMLDSLTGGLGFPRELAADVYGTFIALVYLTPFLGGILADRLLGYRKSVVIGGLLMAAGYMVMGLPSLGPFYIGLGLIILGNGFFKPNISTIVGRLYPKGSPLKDAGYNIFYMGINIGAFACNFVAALLRNQYGWGWAFFAAGVGMLIGVLIFVLNQKHLADAPDRGDGSDIDKGILVTLSSQVILPAVVAGAVGYFFLGGIFGGATTAAFVAASIPVVIFYLLLWLRAPRHEKGPIGALLAIFSVVVVFWMIFHQNGSTLTYWADENTTREAGVAGPALRAFYLDQDATIGETITDPGAQGSYWRNVAPEERPAPGEKVTLISTELFQSINPGFIILLTPLVVGAFAWLRKRRREPSTPAKIAWGMVITALSTIFMLGAVAVSHGGLHKVSALWLVGTYGVITVGELCLSPMGLALVSKVAPARVTALMMGGWFLSTAIGNKLAGVLAAFWEKIPLMGIFGINFAAAVLAGVAIALMTPSIRKIIRELEESTE
ncbi:MAG: peptide MFS transporter [Acidobacteriota bacterium]|nr:MAG: peptide MFS transporter [Acidobacteriota bacterium]